jgi:hypothetical protein
MEGGGVSDDVGNYGADIRAGNYLKLVIGVL